MEIISKRDGGDRREREFRRVLQENRHTIGGLAKQLTQNSMPTRPKAEILAVVEEASRSFGYVGNGAGREIEPWVRISPNDRVILMDVTTCRQIAYLGVLCGRGDARTFVLATHENGFIAPLDDERTNALRDLDGCRVQGAEEEFAKKVAAALGMPTSRDTKDSD
jgi:hypothetical protein